MSYRRLFILSLFLILVLPASAEPICKIIDGDTFRFCNGKTIRLDAIDTPESKEPFYWEARSALAELLQTRNIELRGCHTDNTGKRQACQVFADGKDVQAEMVRQGMAWDWPKYSNGRYATLEAKAKSARLGLWIDDKAEQVHWLSRKRK